MSPSFSVVALVSLGCWYLIFTASSPPKVVRKDSGFWEFLWRRARPILLSGPEGKPKMTTQTKPVFEPKTQAFINALASQGGKPLYQLSYAVARKVLEDAQAVPVAKLP